MDELTKVCLETAEHGRKLLEGMETICEYLNRILEVVPDYIYNGNDDTIHLHGFYVDEWGRLRYETLDNNC